MKTTFQSKQSGGTLIITVVVGALIGTMLASLLSLINSRNRSAMRANAWNSAIPVLEAGIEEALTHLQYDKDNPTSNGWRQDSVDGNFVYWKYRALPDGSYFYVTNFGVATTSPFIHSAGYVPSPLAKDAYISRLVEVGATNPPTVFLAAIAANGQINLSGNAIVDGYDSKFPYGPKNRKANGRIATNSKLPRAISVGTGHVYGMAVTGHGGTVDVAGGSVGELTWTDGIETGWTNNDMNVQFHPNSPPGGTTPLILSSSTVNEIRDGVFKISGDVNINRASAPMVVTGNATVWVTGNFVVTGIAPNAGYIYIAPGASLMLYVGGTTTSISGGGIVNSNGLPSALAYFGLQSNTSVSYSGSADFVGTINAPKAAVSLSGLNGTGANVYGAVICDTFTCSGGSQVHYDQAAGIQGNFLVTAWREL